MSFRSPSKDRRKNLSVLALGVVLAFVFACAAPPAAAARGKEFKYVTDGHEDIASVVDVVPTDGDKQYLRGYAQWVTFKFSLLKADPGTTLVIRNAGVSWGKWYDCKIGKDSEVYPPNDVKITSTDSPKICACGRDSSPSGVTGSFDIYDGDVQVVHVDFNCPWGTQSNSLTTSDESINYLVSLTGQSIGSGPLGDVIVKIVSLT